MPSLKDFTFFFLRRPTGANGYSLGYVLLENNIFQPDEYYVYFRQQRHLDGYDSKRDYRTYSKKIDLALAEFDDLGIELDNVAYISEMTDAVLIKIKDESNLRLLQLMRPVSIEGITYSGNNTDRFYIISSNKYLEKHGFDYKEIAAWIDREPVKCSYKPPIGVKSSV